MKRRDLSRSKTGGKRMAPRKPKFVAEVMVTGRREDEGKVVGSAKIEQLPGGNFIAHIDASGMTVETLRRGFSLGSFSVPEEPIVQLEKMDTPSP